MKSSEAALADQGLRHAPNDRVYDWLRDIAQNVRTYMQAPAVLLPFTNDARLVASLEANGKTERMAEMLRSLGGDALAYADRFRAIQARHSSRRGSSVDADDLFVAIRISQDYIQLMTSYEAVVVATIEEALVLLEQAGLDTSAIRVAADRTLVYNLFQEQPAQPN
jgi:hypothetical protein